MKNSMLTCKQLISCVMLTKVSGGHYDVDSNSNMLVKQWHSFKPNTLEYNIYVV